MSSIQIHYNRKDSAASSAVDKILTPDALTFLEKLHRTFEPTRQSLLAKREERQRRWDTGVEKLEFLKETEHIRNDPTWSCAPPAPGLEDRRVEITGPTDRKMVVNALNSGAKTFMADFEDSSAPTFANMINGQANLYDAVRRQVDFESNGKPYKLIDADKTATLIVRPRGWHLDEPRLTVNGQPISGSLFDFALYFFHNAKELVARGKGPYYYVPKMEHYLEARLWNDVFNFAQSYIGMKTGTIRATALLETIPAAFQMEEFLYELREHSSGLNCGRWDYIFSFIKKHRADPSRVLPDRKDVTMTVPFMDAYVRLLIKTCHSRKVAAMGGMSAQIPVKGDDKANEIAMQKVYADKEREVKAGHDGTWIAHPLINKIAREVFDAHMHGANQYHVRREDVNTASMGTDLINPTVPGGKITKAGVKENVDTAIAYTSAWIGGNGCIPLNFMMEDAATAEITRVQLWQWVKYGSRLDTGEIITRDLVDAEIDASVQRGVKGVEPKNVKMVGDYLKAQIRKAWPSEFLTSDWMSYLAIEDGVDAKFFSEPLPLPRSQL